LLHTQRYALTTESNLFSSLSYTSTKDKQRTNQHSSSTTVTHNLMHPTQSQINLAKQYQTMWEFRSSGMWWCTGGLVCTNVLKEHTAFIFKGWRVKIILPWQWRENIQLK